MREIRMLVIGSISGDDESVFDEKRFQVDDDHPEQAALEAATWMRKLADGLAEEANS